MGHNALDGPSLVSLGGGEWEWTHILAFDDSSRTGIFV